MNKYLNGGQDVEVISRSLLIYGVFASRIQLSWSIISGGIKNWFVKRDSLLSVQECGHRSTEMPG